MSLVLFDGVWKKFRRGERHDSLRDLVPAAIKRAFGPRPSDQLTDEEFWALRDVSFTVGPGEALGIIGPNGAGKSTTLKLLTKILKPTKGRCAVRGRIGALIEVAAGFHPDLTGRENIYLQGAVMGMKRVEIQKRFDEIVDFSGVGEFIDTPVKRYSSGMNARLGFSIAAHLDPDVLIIDEVLAVGDATFQDKCYNRMDLFRAQGAAIVFVSHNLHAIERLCQHALLLRSGASAAAGPVADVLFKYIGDERNRSLNTAQNPVSIDVSRSIVPGDDLLSVAPSASIRFHVHLRLNDAVAAANVGIVVWDVARSLYVYGVTSESIGLPPVSGQAGECSSYDFSLRANLTRGLYAVEINVFDTGRQALVAVLMPALQFNVVEQQSYGGVANLFLQGAVTYATLNAGTLVTA